jgi:hypothetical protein
MARGLLDTFAGGPGLKKGRRDARRLEKDEVFHFWRVDQVQRPHRLVLASRMKAPGEALMVFQLRSISEGTELVVQSVFLSRGISGLGYWYSLYPAHRWVFYGMLKGIAQRCHAPVLSGPQRIAANP